MEKLIKPKANLSPYNDQISRIYRTEGTNFLSTRNITFQVTDDCPMACTYCYQINKGHRKMTKEVAKQCVDLLFDMYEKNDDPFINHDTKAIILDFIGGEPLMNIEVIDYVCTYFYDKCLELDHPWLYTWRASMTTNAALYFEPEVQDFLKRFKGRVGLSITLDGPKEIHDACRIYHSGRGNFDDAYAAMKHFTENYYKELGTKVTIAPENLTDIHKILKFFVEEGFKVIYANTVYEAEWTYDHAKTFYEELKLIADYLLELNDDTSTSLFEEDFFRPMDPEHNNNWCGGTGDMLAFGPNGVAYPCLRYMESSLGNEVEPLVIGSAQEGLFNKPEHRKTQDFLNSITRRSQSTDECFNCPIAQGCAWCSAWNYQLYGTPNKRCTYICPMHKARALANVYYWNKWYILNDIDKRKKMYLPKEEALKIISEDEYINLDILSTL